MMDQSSIESTAEAERVDRGADFLGKAIDALLRLESRNTITSRCVNYLRQLLGLVNSWSK